MALKHLGYVDLPPHVGSGGFDHAAVYQATGRVYVAHTANDAIDVIDMLSGGERGEGGVRVRALCHLRSADLLRDQGRVCRLQPRLPQPVAPPEGRPTSPKRSGAPDTIRTCGLRSNS